ncbi:MAG: response regulator [Candidatus Thermoplasmatota archaeon]|jgi:PAS domain S-box-containing protein|nr:response regulator [Candidatus Thermoplasmatota archaeon]
MMKVLIAEDDPVTRKKLVALLEDWGYGTESAPDGSLALEMMRRWSSPGLALVDWEMPGLTGTELCETVRKDPSLRTDYLIMVTSKGRKEDMLKGFSSGFDDYLTKPFDAEELRARVRVGERILSLEKELRDRAADAEGNYGDLLESFSGGVIQIDMDDMSGPNSDIKVISANLKFCSMLDLTREDIIGSCLDRFVHPGDHQKFEGLLLRKDGGPICFDSVEASLLRKDGITIYVRSSFIELIGAGTGKRTMLVTFEDMTKERTTHLELMRRTLNYRIEEGKVYLVLEKAPSTYLQAFKDLLGIGYHGTVLSRREVSEFRRMVDGTYSFHWVSGTDVGGSIPPDPKVLGPLIKGLPSKEVLLLERMDYLISRSGFDEVLHFVQTLSESTMLKGSIAILSVDPATLSDKERALLMNECDEMEPYFRSNISEELYKVLKVVQKRTSMHLDASLSSIEEELELSRPTSRKRVRQLLEFEFLTEVLKGKEKTYLLTDKGRHIVE